MSNQLEKIKELIERRATALMGGGDKAIAKQHEKGKYTARERIAMLLDEGSFEEMDMFVEHRCTNFGMEKKHYPGDGVVTGCGTIEGRLVYIFAQDFTVSAGSLSETMSLKICKVMDQAMKMGAPCIGINDSGGARIQEGINALAGYAEIFQRNILASGVIPQISGIFGPCAGGAVYSPALTDFTLMMEGTSYMFLTGPKVVKTVTGEDVSQENLGGASVHSTKSGVTHFTAKTEEEGLAMIRKLLSYIPQNNLEEAPYVDCTDPIDRLEDSLNEIIPDSPNKPYDMYEVIGAIVDNGEFLEIQKDNVRDLSIRIFLSETIISHISHIFFHKKHKLGHAGCFLLIHCCNMIHIHRQNLLVRVYGHTEIPGPKCRLLVKLNIISAKKLLFDRFFIIVLHQRNCSVIFTDDLCHLVRLIIIVCAQTEYQHQIHNGKYHYDREKNNPYKTPS